MKIDITPGKYIIAVSGGVDSMVLLHMLVQQKQHLALSPQPLAQRKGKVKSYELKAKDSTSSIELIVAHFNHGIRPDSRKDKELVAQAAKRYNLPFEVGHGKLGAGASEEKARQARYKFLESVAKKHKAKGIITAHHQDDLIETAFLNILRGTGRTGLSSIYSRKICRPLLSVPKKEILAYAKSNKIQWHEDSTNSDIRYLRNLIRSRVVSRLGQKQRREVVNNLNKVAKLNKIINEEIATLSHYKSEKFNRSEFIMLPAAIGEEALIYWLRQHEIQGFDRKMIKRLATVIKTGQPGSEYEVVKGRKLKLTVRWVNLI